MRLVSTACKLHNQCEDMCSAERRPGVSMQVQYGTVPGDYSHTATGRFTFYDQAYANASYTTGHLHHVKLDRLQDNTTYYYRWVVRLLADCTDIPLESMSPASGINCLLLTLEARI